MTRSPRKRSDSNELFSWIGGKKQDAALHDEILDNPAADRALAEIAIKRAIARGLSRAEAEQFYGVR